MNAVLKLRKEILKLSQPEFAEIVGVSRNQIASIEIGRSKSPKVYQAIAETLAVDLDSIQGEQVPLTLSGKPYTSVDGVYAEAAKERVQIAAQQGLGETAKAYIDLLEEDLDVPARAKAAILLQRALEAMAKLRVFTSHSLFDAPLYPETFLRRALEVPPEFSGTLDSADLQEILPDTFLPEGALSVSVRVAIKLPIDVNNPGRDSRCRIESGGRCIDVTLQDHQLVAVHKALEDRALKDRRNRSTK